VSRSVTPVGLTRAEEASAQRQPEVRVVVKAPPGAVKCRASVPPDGADCAAAATHLVSWPDGDTTPMCRDCSMRTEQLAESHRAPIRVEPIR